MLSIQYAQLDDALWLGSYPQSPEDVLHLKSIGVTGVLNVQSDLDLNQRAISWEMFWKFYISQGLKAVRVPIIDFDDADLARGLPLAVTTLDEMLSDGLRVYLHCTGGLNRSPTVAIGWYVRHRQMSLEEASQSQMSQSQAAYPNCYES